LIWLGFVEWMVEIIFDLFGLKSIICAMSFVGDVGSCWVDFYLLMV
jgi:hypothetical protein